MTTYTQASLRYHNTFGVDVCCRRLSSVNSMADLVSAMDLDPEVFVLGGGSNLLLLEDVDKHVMSIDWRGREVIHREGDHVWIRAGAGEEWHALVMWTLEQGYGGLENLSLIPGKVGASPIQNIGAYGVELQDVFHSLTAVDLESMQELEFGREACRFGYRDSFFKQEGRGRFIITEVTYKLRHQNYEIRSDYGSIAGLLEERGIAEPTPHDISEAVIQIRKSKLPDPSQLGNSGSFFKNPAVSADQYEQLVERCGPVRHYPIDEEKYKIPAGWLIDQCGWKGYRSGSVGVYPHQALVLVNYGGATGAQLWQLASDIREDVYQRFGIQLEPEVHLVGRQGIILSP